MKKEVFEQIKKESLIIGIIFILTLVAFKIIFLPESLLVVFKTVLSIFWLFVLPGFIIMYYWKESLKFHERLIIGIVLSAATIGLLSYHIGLLGLNIKYHAIVLPLVLIIVGIVINMRK